MNDTLRVSLLLFVPLLLQLAGLLSAVLSDTYVSRRNRGLMLGICALALLLSATDPAKGLSADPAVLYLAAALGCALPPAILALFLEIVNGGKRTLLPWLLTGLNAALYFSAPLLPLGFRVTEAGELIWGPLAYVTNGVSCLLLLELGMQTTRRYRGDRHRLLAVPVSNILLILAAILADAFIPLSYAVSYQTMAMVSGCVFFYIWLHRQYVREHERELIAGQQVEIMLSQIRPHFLYNSLGTIESLCQTDPQAAGEATAKFARYLRGNMDSIGAEGLSPFQKELEHTRLYLELEQLRFEDALTVKYYIGCRSFSIPSLTLQPLVENAVRHGVRGKPDGVGTVILRSREFADRYEIVVEDDGPGFDPRSLPEDGRSHVGIRNVRERLRHCGGDLRIESGAGKGTRVTVLMPKREGEPSC